MSLFLFDFILLFFANFWTAELPPSNLQFKPYIERLECEDMNIAIGMVSTGIMNKVSGDCEMKDRSPQVTVNLIIERRATKIIITGNVRIQENDDDRSIFEGVVTKTVMDLSDYDDCRYVGTDENEGHVRSEDHVSRGEVERYTGTGFVEWVDCIARVRGNNCGKLYCEMRIKPITVRLKSRY